jgi:hypothetical protein
MTTRWNPEGQRINQRWASCGHPHCSKCKTKRGRNLGNRRMRHAARRALAAVRLKASRNDRPC